MISINGKDMNEEYEYIAQFGKNETATMFFLKKKLSLVLLLNFKSTLLGPT